MNLQAGLILKSTTDLDATIFADSSVLIVEWNNNGAIGFIINKLYGRSLHQLEEFRQVPLFNLYNGGPVDQEHLYFIHRCPHLIDGGVFIQDNLYWGGNFTQVVNGILKGTLTNKDVKIFVGYCGWDKGELEAEIAEGSWALVNENKEIFK